MKLLISLLFTVCSIVCATSQSMVPVKEALALTPAQEISAKQIQTESSIQMRGIYKLKATNPVQYSKEREKIALATDAKFKQILSADQYAAYSKIRKEQSERFNTGPKPTALKKKIVIQ